MQNKILEEVNKLIKHERLNSTFIDGVNIYKISDFLERCPLTYDICLVIILQGKKIGYLPNKKFEYDKNNYLVVPITLPFECETFASKDEPVIGLTININKQMMIDIISSLSIEEKKESNQTSMGVFQGRVTSEIEDILYRLVKVLQSKQESDILGDSILRELYYRIATGENAHFLHKMFLEQQKEAKIAKSLKKIHDNFNQSIDVTSLAKEEQMSVSSYHRYFKEITSYTPLQYIKKIKLNKAKELIENKKLQVNDTAYEVGYISVSQFSRDFKNYFGFPPKEAKIN